MATKLTQEELEYYEEKRKLQEEESKRMACGTCDRCKTEKVKLNPYGIWDICDNCIKNIQKLKKKSATTKSDLGRK